MLFALNTLWYFGSVIRRGESHSLNTGEYLSRRPDGILVVAILSSYAIPGSSRVPLESISSIVQRPPDIELCDSDTYPELSCEKYNQ